MLLRELGGSQPETRHWGISVLAKGRPNVGVNVLPDDRVREIGCFAEEGAVEAPPGGGPGDGHAELWGDERIHHSRDERSLKYPLASKLHNP